MNVVTVKKGVSLPIAGAVPPNSVINERYSDEYAFLAQDFPYLKPRVLVKEGDSVFAGTPIVFDKSTGGCTHVSPFSGTVKSVIRGDKRSLIAVVISGIDRSVWQHIEPINTNDLTPDLIKDYLASSGMWAGVKARPFGVVANIQDTPSAIFITAIDTRPLAADVELVLKGRETFFENGVRVLSKLTSGKCYVAVSPDTKLPIINDGNIETVGFKGPHPAGLAGTHIHFLHPVSRKRTVWEVNYQDVANIGELFSTGVVNTTKVISLAGEGVKSPSLIRTNQGANINHLLKGDIKDNFRLINGSPLYGDKISSTTCWLGRYNYQISAIPEGADSTLLSWLTFGIDLHSIKRIFVSNFFTPKEYNFDTSMRGSIRSMVPVGSYEQVMPMDIIITPFLRYLDAGDAEMCEKMGVLELVEEDLSLATYVSPEKTDFAPILRSMLDTIHKEIY